MSAYRTRPATASHHVIRRAAEIRRHHADEAKPGKPMWLLIPGALLAILSAVVMGYRGYPIWVRFHDPAALLASLWWVLLLYFLGVYCFLYGYELYDWRRALWLTPIVGIVGIVVLVLVVALVALAGEALDGLDLGGGHGGGGGGDLGHGGGGGHGGGSGHVGGGSHGDGSWADGLGDINLPDRHRRRRSG